MTEQEIEAIYKKMREGIQLTNDEMIKLARESGYMAGQFKRASVSIDEFKANIKKAGDELPAALLKVPGALTKSLGGVAKSLGEAETGFKALNPIIDSVANALSKVPYVGFAFQAAAEASKFMVNQLQNATDAFQEVSKVGGLTARGMTGLQEQFLRSGMQLKSYTKTITANSAALANFAGSVGAGAEQFSRTAGMVQKEFGQGLARLGYGFDEIGEVTASYIARQTRLGLAQGKSNEVLAAGAAKYASELDELSKLTGASKEEIKKQQDAVQSEVRFRAKLDTLIAQGDIEGAKRLEDANTLAMAQSEKLARAFRDASTGFIGTSEESKAGFMATAGVMTDIATNAHKADPSETLRALQNGVNSTIPMLRDQALMGNDVTGMYAELSKFSKSQLGDLQAVRKESGQLKTAPDKLTEQTVDAQRNMQKLSLEIQKLGFEYMPAAATAVNGVTKALRYLTGSIAKDTGTADPLAGAGSSQTGAYHGTAKAMSPAQKAAAKRQAVLDQRAAKAEAAATGSTGDLGAGPVFGAPDTTRADRVQVTLDEIREELKKLVKLGGISGVGSAGGQQAAQAALAEHDHAHPHPPAADVSPELAAKIGTLVAPLEKMNQTSGFIRNDGKTMHGAIDLAGKIGDKVMAPISGVAKVLSDPKGYGNYVEVTDTITGVKHILAHLDKTMVKTGDVIKAGTQIGTVGNTGMSTGAHLHHEVRLPDGTKIDPSQFYAGAKRAPGAGGALGSLAQKYESGAAGSMAVGVDKVGGTSYGKYQIASKVGAMDDFLKMLDKTNPEAAARLRGAGPADAGTGGKFAQEWKALAKSGALGDAESQFAMEKIFKPAMGGLKDQGLKKMIEGNKGLQEMFHSTAVQHGATGGSGILNKVYKPGMSKEDLVKATYAERGTRFGGSTEEVRASVQGRFGREQQDVLAMLGMPGAAPGATTATTLATPRAPTAAPVSSAATAGLAGQGQNVISSGLSAITTALFGGGAQGAPGTADAGIGGGGSETVALLSQLVALSRDQNSNLSKILSASTA